MQKSAPAKKRETQSINDFDATFFSVLRALIAISHKNYLKMPNMKMQLANALWPHEIWDFDNKLLYSFSLFMMWAKRLAMTALLEGRAGLCRSPQRF